MDISLYILHSLLKAENFARARDISSLVFSDYVREIYDVLKEYRDTHSNADISLDELKALYLTKNGGISSTRLEFINEIFSQLEGMPPLAPDIFENYISSLNKREIARQIAEKAIGIVNGDEGSLDELRDILAANTDTSIIVPKFKVIEPNLDELLALTDVSGRFRFNIPTLDTRLPGFGRGELAIIFARPETGKSGFHISLSAAPNGFIHSGHKVHAMLNEELGHRALLRAINACSGVPLLEIPTRKDVVQRSIQPIKDNLTYMNVDTGFSTDDIRRYLDRYEADILVIDQMDKVQVPGSFQRGDERLQKLYQTAREIAKEYNIAVVAITQARGDAENKMILSLDQMDGSRTGKAAEADIVLGLGRGAITEAPGGFPTLFLCVLKNKINGWHGEIRVMINQALSRIS